MKAKAANSNLAALVAAHAALQAESAAIEKRLDASREALRAAFDQAGYGADRTLEFNRPQGGLYKAQKVVGERRTINAGRLVEEGVGMDLIEKATDRTPFSYIKVWGSK